MFETHYAHRGLWGPGAPENSLAAFRCAIKAGIGIELDVRLSADSVPVVFHDASLTRMTGHPQMVEDLNARDLAHLRLLDTAQTIPTLRTALDLIDGHVPVLVELKGEFGAEGTLELMVADLLEDYDGPVAVISFNPMSLALMRAFAPQVMRGQTTYGWHDNKVATLTAAERRALRQLRHLDEVKPDFLCIGGDALPSGPVHHWRKHGLPVISWTARTATEARRLAKFSDAVMFERFSPHALPQRSFA